MRRNLERAYEHAIRWAGQGNTASFIPELATVDPNRFGISMTDLGGNTCGVGDCKAEFTIQSISKLLLLAVAIGDSGIERVFSRVGMEPSGDAFNSIYRMELISPKPANPMINAGAIAVTSCIRGNGAEERFSKVRQLAERCFAAEEVALSEKVYACETQTGNRNRALTCMMLYDRIIEGDPDEHLDVYYRACSMLVTCEKLAIFGATLANEGVSPKTRERIFDAATAAMLRSLMASCGLYNESGEFALRAGIPAKSGSGGGIMAAVKGRYGIATFSPNLDSRGNSVCGIKALEFLSRELNLGIY